jgi:replicative DNA helicase
MPDFQVIERLVSSYGRINKTELKNNFPEMNDDAKMTQYALHAAACESVGKSNIYIDDRHSNSVSKIRREVRKIVKKHGSIGGIFVDYLTLMEADGKHDRNDLAVASMTRALKGMSKEFMWPVIMLLQLNRANTTRVDKRPLSSDSRDSGAIEQDVDSWIGLYRDSVYNTDSPWKNITEIIVRLNRHGEIGTCYQQITSYGFVDVNEHDVARLVHMEESAPAKKVKTNDF